MRLPSVAPAGAGTGGAAVLVAERADADRHLMVAITVDPAGEAVLRAAVDAVLEADGLWCGVAAASPGCRAGLLDLAVAGGVSADVVDAAGYDEPDRARAECLGEVETIADAAGVDSLVLARDDSCAADDAARAGELAPRCTHADTGAEPLIALAGVLVWCWWRGGDTRRSVAAALRAVYVV